MEIGTEIQETDALKIKADVLVLKYAQNFFLGCRFPGLFQAGTAPQEP